MRRFLLLACSFTLPTAACVVLAQAPPTRVEKAAAEDAQTGELPSTASWRGAPVGERPYAETPSIEEAGEAARPPAGAYDQPHTPEPFATDGDNLPIEVNDPSDFEEPTVAERIVTERLDPDGAPEEWRYSYGATGEITGVDRYRRGQVDPYARYEYEYTAAGGVIERQVMPDGARRFVREMGLDEFQASQGPGNQDYRDNRDATQAYPVENAARPTPTNPRLGSDVDVSPQR